MDASARWGRWRLALGLVILPPLCAESLVGYDDTTGDFTRLAFGLLIFGPLYGCPALLIRETARRLGVGWPGIVTLALAFGVLEAGVVDQSVFSESYRQIDYWEALIRPTWIPALGLSAHASMGFLMGHVIWSFCIPIALIESLNPKLAERPWLRRPGLIVTALLYLGAAALVLGDHLDNEQDHASTAQVVGSLGVAAALVAFAFTAGRARPSPARDRAVPNPGVVVALSLVGAFGFESMPSTWPGFAAALTVLASGVAAIEWASRSSRWRRRHVAALATGALLARAVEAFLVVPLGDVPPAAKYAHNVAFLLGSILLGVLAMACSRSAASVLESARGGG